MGHEVTLNYIVKSSNKEELLNISKIKNGDEFTLSKNGNRHYMMNCPLYLSDSDWNIIGKCVVTAQSIVENTTYLTCVLLFLFSEEEKEVVTKINQIGESELSKQNQRVNEECPHAKKVCNTLNSESLYTYPAIENKLISHEDEIAIGRDFITIAYVSNGEIHLQGKNVGCLGKQSTLHSAHNKLWINEKGDLQTNIRHSQFKTKTGFTGIAFNQFDLVD